MTKQKNKTTKPKSKSKPESNEAFQFFLENVRENREAANSFLPDESKYDEDDNLDWE